MYKIRTMTVYLIKVVDRDGNDLGDLYTVKDGIYEGENIGVTYGKYRDIYCFQNKVQPKARNSLKKQIQKLPKIPIKMELNSRQQTVILVQM